MSTRGVEDVVGVSLAGGQGGHVPNGVADAHALAFWGCRRWKGWRRAAARRQHDASDTPLRHAVVGGVDSLRLTQNVVRPDSQAQVVDQIGVGGEAGNILEEYEAGLEDLGEAARLKDEPRPLVLAALTVLAAERLTGRADDQEIEVGAAQMASADLGRIDAVDPVFDHSDGLVIEPIGGAGYGIGVDGSDNPKTAALQGGGDCAGPTVQVDGGAPAASASTLTPCRHVTFHPPSPGSMNQVRFHRKLCH